MLRSSFTHESPCLFFYFLPSTHCYILRTSQNQAISTSLSLIHSWIPCSLVPDLTCFPAKVTNDIPIDKHNDLYASYDSKIPIMKMFLLRILKVPTAAIFSFQLFIFISESLTSSLSVYPLDTDILLVSVLGHHSPRCSLISLLMPYVLFYCYLWFL